MLRRVTRGSHLYVLLGYAVVAIVFSWPLPLNLGTHLTGNPGGDTGVYVWNQWVFRHEIFDYIQEGEELVEQPFARLIAERRLATYRHTGFWQAMDTFKDKITFDRMEARGDCPWMRWRQPNGHAGK